MGSAPYNKTLGRLRLVAVYALLAFLLTLARPTLAWATAGAVLVGLGEAVRVWSAGHLVKTRLLVTSGPYRYTRNPLYLGRLFILTGLCVMATMPYGANWLVLVAGWAIFFGYYLPRKERVEPARLREAHGEAYERYRRAVPALFPGWPPYEGETSRSAWSARRMLHNREHWMIVGLAAACLYFFWRA